MTVRENPKTGEIITQIRALPLKMRMEICARFQDTEEAAQAFLAQQQTGFGSVSDWIESL
jgi:hypothetical protein